MSDEVSDFLRSVELLKERREEEDEARSRELEEKILQEKKERQARRAGTQRRNQSVTAYTPPPSEPSIRYEETRACGASLPILWRYCREHRCLPFPQANLGAS